MMLPLLEKKNQLSMLKKNKNLKLDPIQINMCTSESQNQQSFDQMNLWECIYEQS